MVLIFLLGGTTGSVLDAVVLEVISYGFVLTACQVTLILLLLILPRQCRYSDFSFVCKCARVPLCSLLLGWLQNFVDQRVSLVHQPISGSGGFTCVSISGKLVVS